MNLSKPQPRIFIKLKSNSINAPNIEIVILRIYILRLYYHGKFRSGRL